jgi:Dullard-like phosphatase family protein
MKNSENYNFFMQIFKQINNISFENIYDIYINNIFKANIINSTISTASKLGPNKNNNYNTKINTTKNISIKKLYTLVISLDETLIHFKIDNKMKNSNKGVIQLRPWLNEFLSEIKPYYEIIAFSNGDKKYTELILNAIDKNKIFFDNKLCRNNCIIMNNDFVKDISILKKDINKIIIVDNLIQNYRLHLENGINIKSFYGEINDKILLELKKILIKIAKLGGDTRTGIKYFRDDIINKVSSNVYLDYYK